jgi:hypothetical protein
LEGEFNNIIRKEVFLDKQHFEPEKALEDGDMSICKIGGQVGTTQSTWKLNVYTGNLNSNMICSCVVLLLACKW